MDNIKKKRKQWYKKTYVQFELVKAMLHREVVFMDRLDNSKTIRGLFIKTTDYLNHVFKLFNFFEKDYNIYISLAKYDRIPNFTVNLKKRSNETSDWFNNKSFKSIIEYDMLLDFDRKHIKNKKMSYLDMENEVKMMVKILDYFKIEYWVYPSGNNFQIIIPSEIFEFNRDFDRILNQNTFNFKIRYLTQKIKETFRLKSLCMIGIGVHNKISKCPYSLIDNNVALPLYDLDKFNYNKMDCNSILYNYPIYKRGLIIHNNMGLENNKENMIRFLNKLSFTDNILLK